MSSGKSHLLDPLNILFKLSLLNLCESGTRLSILKNIVTIQRPIRGQSIFRYYNRDNQNDLYLLLPSLIKVVEWYVHEIEPESVLKENKGKHKKKSSGNLLELPKEGKEMEKKSEGHDIKDVVVDKKQINKFYKDANLLELMKFACQGLEKLQKFYGSKYNDGMCIIVLQFMINFLNEGIKGELHIDKLPLNHRKIDAVSLIHIKEIAKYWKEDKITETLKLLQDARKYIDSSDNHSEILDGYITTISNILHPLDIEFQKIVEKSFS